MHFEFRDSPNARLRTFPDSTPDQEKRHQRFCLLHVFYLYVGYGLHSCSRGFENGIVFPQIFLLYCTNVQMYFTNTSRFHDCNVSAGAKLHVGASAMREESYQKISRVPAAKACLFYIMQV